MQTQEQRWGQGDLPVGAEKTGVQLVPLGAVSAWTHVKVETWGPNSY